MKNIRKFRRLLAVMLLCTGLSGLASVNTPALGAATCSTLPASSSTNVASASLAYALGYILGIFLASQSPVAESEMQRGSEMQLATPKYQTNDFSSFD